MNIERIKEIAAIPDGQIDTSDIPEITDFSDFTLRHPATRAPTHLTHYMCKLIGVAPHHRVLEPSAGSGGMVECIIEHSPHVLAVELNMGLHGVLEAKGICERSYRRNFLDIKPYIRDSLARNIPAEIPMVDRVIMCPPKDSEAHILHAQKFLRGGGRLAALVQEQNIDPNNWPTYRRTKTRFQMGGKELPCGIITLECLHD